jgi:hypothetical protein
MLQIYFSYSLLWLRRNPAQPPDADAKPWWRKMNSVSDQFFEIEPISSTSTFTRSGWTWEMWEHRPNETLQAY